MIILLVIATLFIGGLGAWLIEGWNKDMPRWVTLASCAIAAALLSNLYLSPTEHEILLAGVSSTWIEHLHTLDSPVWNQLYPGDRWP